MARDAVEMMQRAASDQRQGLRIIEEVVSGVEEVFYDDKHERVIFPGYEPDEIDVIARRIRKRVRKRLSQRTRPLPPLPDPLKLLSGTWVEVP